jgi:PIN domain nuclease of toxin-antitoxin system
VTVLPITLEIALAAPALALPHGDQFDRIIAARAKVHRLPLFTKDANITDASVVDTVW